MATGTAASRPCRPAGRSGAVTASTTASPGRPRSASRIGTAKVPEPRKTVRTGGCSKGPSPVSGERGRVDLAPLLFRLELRHRDQVIERVEVVDVQLALEVVELVLERTAQEPAPGHLDLPAMAVLGDDPDALAACHVGDVAGDRQAAL